MSKFEVRRHTSDSPWTYRDLDLRQREIAEEVVQGRSGKFLLSEVAPVITVGRRTPEADYLNTQTDVYRVHRGGLATYHGPGQWVLFLVDSLEKLTGDRRGVRKMIARLLQIAKSAAEGRGIAAEIREGAELGVWTARGKFAAVGIHVEKGVVLHGLSINGFQTKESFQNLRPCGLDLPVDYLVENPADFELLGQEIQTITQASRSN
jgi:lipoyl(octanoyl) transferase